MSDMGANLDLINVQKISIPDRKFNADTIEAIKELENGDGTRFSGDTEDLLKDLSE